MEGGTASARRDVPVRVLMLVYASVCVRVRAEAGLGHSGEQICLPIVLLSLRPGLGERGGALEEWPALTCGEWVEPWEQD